MTNQAGEFEIVHVGSVDVQYTDADPIVLSDELRKSVDTYWEQAVAASGNHLFNGAFLNLVSWERSGDSLAVKAHFDEYKAFYVHRQHPEFGLAVRSIGVSAVSRILNEPGHEPDILFAVRGPKMTQYPGLLELVPSGTVDRSCVREDGTVDYVAMAVSELEEEARIGRACVRHAEGFAFIHDRLDDSYDLCCRLDLEVPREALLRGFEDNPEYSEPITVPEPELADFLAAEAGRLMPVSKGLGRAYLQLTANRSG